MMDDVSITNRIKENWDDIKEMVWQECHLTYIAYRTWIEPLKFIKFTDGVAYVLFPFENDFALNFLKNKFSGIFVENIADAAELDGTISDISVEFTFDAKEV